MPCLSSNLISTSVLDTACWPQAIPPMRMQWDIEGPDSAWPSTRPASALCRGYARAWRPDAAFSGNLRRSGGALHPAGGRAWHHRLCRRTASWDALHAFDARRINHSISFHDEGADTHQAESFFSRLRRAEIGQHHCIRPSPSRLCGRDGMARGKPPQAKRHSVHELAPPVHVCWLTAA